MVGRRGHVSARELFCAILVGFVGCGRGCPWIGRRGRTRYNIKSVAVRDCNASVSSSRPGAVASAWGRVWEGGRVGCASLVAPPGLEGPWCGALGLVGLVALGYICSGVQLLWVHWPWGIMALEYICSGVHRLWGTLALGYIGSGVHLLWGTLSLVYMGLGVPTHKNT